MVQETLGTVIETKPLSKVSGNEFQGIDPGKFVWKS